MQRIIFIIFIALVIACNAKQSSPSIPNTQALESLVNLGVEQYSTNPQLALDYLRAAGAGYESLDSFRKAGTMYLNVAGLYEEQLLKPDSAMMYAGKSLDNFIKSKEDMQVANLEKYYGYLLGLNGQYAEGEDHIHKAIIIYEANNFEQGIAVSHFNLARLASLQKDYVRSDSLLDQARIIWLKHQDAGRLLLLNVQQMENNAERNQHQLNRAYIQEMDSLLLIAEMPAASKAKYDELKKLSE